MTKPSYVEFAVPQGVTMPETDSENGEFDLVCTFKPKGDNKVCLVKFGDMPMPEKGDKAPSYREVSQNIASDMNQAMPQQDQQ